MLERLGKAVIRNSSNVCRIKCNAHESEGYQYDSAEASFAILALKESGRFTPHFERIRSFERVDTSGSVSFTEATLKLRVGEHEEHVVGEEMGLLMPST